ncbi:MAG: hypothetical protein JSV52_01295 [Candidatus Zixiibacteriota bacterium]|nr:MAG: hypothetical protein JSV52_01295 [candidate division Zixibacteria bacterium]
MKINPIAIQSYQQAVRRDEKPALQTQNNDQAATAPAKVKIAPQNEGAESRVAVRAHVGNYADILTPEEKNALDLLFSKFRDAERFGPGYRVGDIVEDDDSLLGGIIDLKV